MDLNKFTIKSQQALQEAQQSATEHQNQALENGHVLKGVLKTDKHVTPFILKKIGANPKMIEQALDQIIADEFIKYNKDILLERLRKERIACGVLNSINDLENHPQLRKVKCIIGNEEVELIAPPSIVKGEKNRISKIPNIGENSIDIRKEFNE